ncbi:cadherin EGF LAG seven-pass G-type receptor 3-like [Arapaima gigas]
MEPLCRLLVVVFIPSVCFHGAAVQSSPINCQSGSLEELGPFDENYLGDVEELTGVPAGENLQLVEYLFQGHVDFLELIFTPGNSSATVKTKKPLDADTQPLTEGSLYYSVMCLSTNLKNSRVLHITDLNDHRPVFEKKEHQTSISESLPVGSSVLKVTAKDADATSANNRVTYRFLPPAPSNFELRYDGTIQLARSLDYNIAKVYSFTVEAQDPKGLYDTTTVNVTVEDFDNMNPSFNHNVYHAAVMENEAGPVLNILPEAIEAKDGDMGINQSVVYSISTVSPGKYLSNFNMDPNSGVITMGTGLDREEVDVVVINIKVISSSASTLLDSLFAVDLDAFVAAQQDVPQKTADATVFVKVEDVNDNPPQFGKDNYNFSVFENLPAGALLFILDVTDADEAGFSEGFFIVNSDMFSINKHGVVLLNSNASLDRETQDMYILKVVAVDSPNSSFSTTAQLNITILDINDNNPQFSTLPDTAYIAEGDYSPTSPAEVCHISVYDLDYGDNGRVTLSIATLEPNVSFVIQENGTLLAVGPLDRETKDIYELVIVATDHGTPENMNVTVVEVRISDINDHDPEFSQEIYSKSLLLREAVEGSHVLTLSASDKDADNNSLITYSFSTDCPLLKLDGKTGNITLGTGLSHIVNDTLLNLTAEAHDHGLPSRSSTGKLRQVGLGLLPGPNR